MWYGNDGGAGCGCCCGDISRYGFEKGMLWCLESDNNLSKPAAVGSGCSSAKADHYINSPRRLLQGGNIMDLYRRRGRSFGTFSR